jgi:hypothetical protein
VRFSSRKYEVEFKVMVAILLWTVVVNIVILETLLFRFKYETQ